MTFGAYDNELLAAVDSGDANRVADLLDKGADVNAKDNDSLTPLHLAAINDHLNVVEKLMKRGADVNAIRTIMATFLYIWLPLMII